MTGVTPANRGLKLTTKAADLRDYVGVVDMDFGTMKLSLSESNANVKSNPSAKYSAGDTVPLYIHLDKPTQYRRVFEFGPATVDAGNEGWKLVLDNNAGDEITVEAGSGAGDECCI